MGVLMKSAYFIPLVVLADLSALSVMAQTGTAQAIQPTQHSEWAIPLALAGVPNLHRVTPNFYRSAQPDAQGFAEIVKRYAVRSVVSLRAFHSDNPLTKGLPLRLYDFPMHTWHIEREDVVGALRALRISTLQGPTLLHCEHGADRTGLITALYRILYQGWSKDAALDEMQNGDFGFHDVWINIPRYLREIDTVQLKKEVGEP
jgi:protein tyrosine/serine phosphatase